MRRTMAVLVGGLLMLAGCVTLPVGPNVAVLPAPEKPQEVFVADDAACRAYAAQQTGLTQPHIMAQHELRSAVLGPLLGGAAGAALGAAFGAAAGHAGLGAATGAGAGLVLGTAGGAAAGSGAAGGGSRGAMTGPTNSAWLPRETRCRAIRGSRRLRRPPGCHHNRLARDIRDSRSTGSTVVSQQHAGHTPSILMRLAQASPHPWKWRCKSPGDVAQRVS
jgi:hypothetical protein